MERLRPNLTWMLLAVIGGLAEDKPVEYAFVVHERRFELAGLCHVT
jgi:hypothetical protein